MSSVVPEMRVVRDRPRLPVSAGASLRLLVVAARGPHCAGVDLETGALVRTWAPAEPQERVRPYDVVEVECDADSDLVPDPAQPESVGVAAPAVVVGRLTGRRAERLLRPLLHPELEPLLGVTATAIPFWERSPDHPSIAVVEPRGRVTMVREGAYLGCRFPWRAHERELPCLDRALAGYMDRRGMARLVVGRGDRLVVSLTAPIDGRCHKVVESLLPRR